MRKVNWQVFLTDKLNGPMQYENKNIYHFSVYITAIFSSSMIYYSIPKLMYTLIQKNGLLNLFSEAPRLQGGASKRNNIINDNSVLFPSLAKRGEG